MVILGGNGYINLYDAGNMSTNNATIPTEMSYYQLKTLQTAIIILLL